MRIFLLGATGRTGTELVDLGLAHGHTITAFVRSPHKLAPRRGLDVVAGDPRSTDAVRAAVGDHDAVVSAIGPAPRDALTGPSALLTDCAASTVAAMTRAGVRRLAIVSAAVLFPERGLTFAFFRWLLRHHIRDLTTMEAVVGASGLAWTIVRPPRLVKSPDERYVAEIDALPQGRRVTSFRAVAKFLLDALERGQHVGDIVGLAR